MWESIQQQRRPAPCYMGNFQRDSCSNGQLQAAAAHIPAGSRSPYKYLYGVP
jgi:hypothetical protein